MTPENLAAKYRKLIKEKMPQITTAHDDTGHWYIYNGKKYPSVTGILRTIKDEGLSNWKMNRALEYVAGNWNSVRQYDPKDISKILEDAKLAPAKEFTDAGNIGTIIHDWREGWFKRCIENNEYKVYTGGFHSEPAICSGERAIKKFLENTGYIPVACELYVASEELGLAGTLDDIGVLPNPVKKPGSLPGSYTIKYRPKLVLIDLKTSNIGDKTSYFLQVALYYHMFRKLTGISCQECYILHVSKTDGSYKLIPIKNIRLLIKDAHILLKLNKSLERIVEDKKKETVMI